MRKIYNKNGFKRGLFFLILGVVSIIVTIIRFDSLDILRVIKNTIIDTLLCLIGINSIFRSYSYENCEEDSRENDERSKLIELRAKSSSFMICLYICFALNILLILGYAITKVEVLLYLYIPLGLMSGIVFITIILTSLYYEKKS